MRILSAIYSTEDGTEKEIYLDEVTPSLYEKELKGKLHCITKNCPARISFSGGKKAHFKTWRFDEHSIDCIFQFDRIPINLGTNTTETISLEIPFNRRQNALQEAFILMNLTEEEKAARQKKRTTSGNQKPRAITTNRKKNANSMQMVLFDGDLFEDELVHRRKNISKRYVDEITETDIGEIRLIMGEVKSVKEVAEVAEVAEIVVEYNNEIITVVFEEAFIAERLNSSYLNKFWSIGRLLSQEKQALFTGIGEVRKNSRTSRLELVIYVGSDFKVNNIDMFRLAAWFAREDL